MKSVQIRSYFWSVFSCIRTEYGDLRLNLRIQYEYRKIRTRNNSVFGHFSRSEFSTILLFENCLSISGWRFNFLTFVGLGGSGSSFFIFQNIFYRFFNIVNFWCWNIYSVCIDRLIRTKVIAVSKTTCCHKVSLYSKLDISDDFIPALYFKSHFNSDFQSRDISWRGIIGTKPFLLRPCHFSSCSVQDMVKHFSLVSA